MRVNQSGRFCGYCLPPPQIHLTTETVLPVSLFLHCYVSICVTGAGLMVRPYTKDGVTRYALFTQVSTHSHRNAPLSLSLSLNEEVRAVQCEAGVPLRRSAGREGHLPGSLSLSLSL